MVLYNSIIPFKGYKAINLFGIIFARKEYTLDDVDINHELIHTAQMKEMLYIFFYMWYIVEWFLKLLYYFDSNKAYKYISFEVEAYTNESNMNYLVKRKHFNWLKLL